MKYKIWNKTDNLVTPTMKVLTPQEVFEQFPASQLPNFKFIICDNPVSMGVFMEFESTKEHYKKLGADIGDDMTDEEVLQAITDFEEKPQSSEPTPEERLASMKEFEVMMKIIDSQQ